MPRPTAKDAELILRLFEMRREPEMRRARAFMISEFTAKSWNEVRPHFLTGSDLDRHFRMVATYWDMVAAFVNRGILNEDLFFDTHGEDLVIWSKIAPMIAEARKHVRPTYLWNLERMARRHQAWRERGYATAATVIETGSKLPGSKVSGPKLSASKPPGGKKKRAK